RPGKKIRCMGNASFLSKIDIGIRWLFYLKTPLKIIQRVDLLDFFDLAQDWQLAYEEVLKKAGGQDVKPIYLKQATIGLYLLRNNDNFYSIMEELIFFTADCNYLTFFSI
ncbi:hypothetical protein GIB67_013350, partial [Kingdonia uniflora]